MPADNEKPPSAEEVTALSIAMRLRAAHLKRTVPADQYQERLIAGQNKLIPEPPGEPGRKPAKINPRTKLPRGYQLQTVLGLAQFQATHNHYMKTVEECAVGMVWGKTYSKQRLNSITLTVSNTLKELPIFHCYDDHWPIHAYLKGILKSKKDTKCKVLKKMEEEGELRSRTQIDGVDPLQGTPVDPLALPEPEGTLPAAGLTQHTAQAPESHAGILDFNLDPPVLPSEDELTPPPPVIPAKRRGRGDPDRNLPNKRNPGAKELGAQAPRATIGAVSSRQAETTTRTRSKTFAVNNSANSEAGPGPSTMAKQKQLAHRRAKRKA